MQCPLTGKPCDRAKNIHVTKIVNKVPSHMDLCEECGGSILPSMSGGVMSLPMLPVSSLFSLFNQLEEQPSSLAELSATLPVCPQCKSSLEQIIKQGRIGCPECYSRFHDQLLPVVQNHHAGATKHQGKVPKYRLLHGNLTALQQQLKTAIGKEDYEQAAKIRDRIKELESPNSKT